MGSSQSASAALGNTSDEEEEEEEVMERETRDAGVEMLKKVLQQEPEMLPCHTSASPLSPQLSNVGTPRLGSSAAIKVWDPFNVLAPPPTFHDVVLVYLISHAESHLNLRPDLISGRSPESSLTSKGKRQARALSVFFNSQSVRFSAVYSSPLDRARATALLVCQEMNIAEEQIRSSDALVEMSHGHWEGCHRSEIMTPHTLSLMEMHQPDFCAPSGESLRQVEFRMVQFLNTTILSLPERCTSDFSPPEQQGDRGSQASIYSFHERDASVSVVPPPPPPHLDLLHRHRQGVPRRKSGKSRLQIVATTGDHEADDEMSPRQPLNQGGGSIHDNNLQVTPCSTSTCIGVFTHSVPIKCLLTGILGCSAAMSHKICLDDSSVTVLQHSWRTGWQIKRLNDNAHLRLL